MLNISAGPESRPFWHHWEVGRIINSNSLYPINAELTLTCVLRYFIGGRAHAFSRNTFLQTFFFALDNF